MSDDEEEECEENCEQCEQCEGHQPIDNGQPQDNKKKQPKNVTEAINKFGKKVKIGKGFSKGQVSKELTEFLEFCRISVDKTFMTSRGDLGQASLGMEKAFENLMKEVKDKHLNSESFTLGVIFGLSRWAFLEAKIVQKIDEAKLHKEHYVV